MQRKSLNPTLSFNTNGFTLGDDDGGVNDASSNYVAGVGKQVAQQYQIMMVM